MVAFLFLLELVLEILNQFDILNLVPEHIFRMVVFLLNFAMDVISVKAETDTLFL